MVETCPVDELPDGVPAPARGDDPGDRADGGRFGPGNAMAAEGGRAKGGKSRLAARLALGDTFADPSFDPYAKAARAFRKAQVSWLAQTVGGGECGPAPSSVIASAALQLAARSTASG